MVYPTPVVAPVGRRLRRGPGIAALMGVEDFLPHDETDLDALRWPASPVRSLSGRRQTVVGGAYVQASRGRVLRAEGFTVVATIHPSAVLRQHVEDGRREAFEILVEDSRVAALAAAAGW